jgi:hypothetical protein
VALGLALRLRGAPGVHRHWHLMLWSAAGAALAGALYHGLLHDRAALAGPGWVVVGVLVVLMLSYLLAGSVHDVLGPGRARVFWVVRLTGLLAYVGLAIVGKGHLTALLLCESLTMAGVLVIWLHAARRRHPRAAGMVAAILASGLAGVVFALPEAVTAPLGLGPAPLSHLAQIPGIVLLAAALGGAHRLVPAWARPRRARSRPFALARRPAGSPASPRA